MSILSCHLIPAFNSTVLLFFQSTALFIRFHFGSVFFCCAHFKTFCWPNAIQCENWGTIKTERQNFCLKEEKEFYRSRMRLFFVYRERKIYWMGARFNMRFGRIDINRITIALTLSTPFTMLIHSHVWSHQCWMMENRQCLSVRFPLLFAAPFQSNCSADTESVCIPWKCEFAATHFLRQ